MNHLILFSKLVGEWEGECKTWFEPDVLADHSTVKSSVVEIYGGAFLRHTYTSTILGNPRLGEELIAFNSITSLFQCAWIDDFHTSNCIMFSQGFATEHGFSVKGEFDAGESLPKWGWRTELNLMDADNLIITAYNVDPNGIEAKAVETIYVRQK